MSKQDLLTAIENLKMNIMFNECADDFYFSNGGWERDNRALKDLESQLASL